MAFVNEIQTEHWQMGRNVIDLISITVWATHSAVQDTVTRDLMKIGEKAFVSQQREVTVTIWNKYKQILTNFWTCTSLDWLIFEKGSIKWQIKSFSTHIYHDFSWIIRLWFIHLDHCIAKSNVHPKTHCNEEHL